MEVARGRGQVVEAPEAVGLDAHGVDLALQEALDDERARSDQERAVRVEVTRADDDVGEWAGSSMNCRRPKLRVCRATSLSPSITRTV
jgi:hypothetical protein